MKTPLGLDLAAVVENDAKLQKVADEGLEYLVLKEDTPLDAQRDISAWRNQDQNSNLAYHEFALIQTILDVAAQEAKRTKGQVSLGTVAATEVLGSISAMDGFSYGSL